MDDLLKLLPEDIRNSLSDEERSLVLQIVSELQSKGYSDKLGDLYAEDYIEIPVSIDEFIESDRYAGWFTNNGKSIYPYWREQLRNMFSPDKSYSEVALTGSIGIGKSTIAVLGLGYMLYRLMCLRDPHTYYNLGKGGYIYVVFFNATLNLSHGVAYTKFQNLLQNSPWFMERGKVTGTKNLEYIPNGPIRFVVGSQIEHSLGRDIFCGLLDEVNFVKGADINIEQSKIMATYNSVLERLSSRFMVNGKIAGKLFIVSSKKSEYDFVESYIQKKRNDHNVYVCDARLWEVKPSGTYSGKTFKIALGGKNVPSRIIEDGEDIEALERQGYSILPDVPLELKPRFEMDMNAALMNIAGVSITYVSRFLSYKNIVRCYIDAKNPFTSNILTIGLADKLTIKEFFLPNLVPNEISSMPIFIHIDTSLTGDRTGIGATAVVGYKYMNEYDIEQGIVVPTKELMYREVFDVAIQCPNGSEISFQKTREFIYYLKHQLGWNIKGISLDGFQSADCRQMLILAGFDNVTIVSLDRTPNGYMTYKSAINEQRIAMLNIPEREMELINLEQNNMTMKVDHPLKYGSGEIGRKDMADASSGSLYNATLCAEDLNLGLIESGDLIVDNNTDDEDPRDRLLSNLVSGTKVDTSDIDIIDMASINSDIDDMISSMRGIVSENINNDSTGADIIRNKIINNQNISNNIPSLEDIRNGIIMF